MNVTILLWIMRSMLLVGVVNAALVTTAVAVGSANGRYSELLYEGWIGSNAEVFLFDAHRRMQHNLTQHPAQDLYPVWSPDGRYIAFESVREGGRWIYIMDASGRGVRRLTQQTDMRESNPAWSLDGTRVLFRGFRRRTSAVYSADVGCPSCDPQPLSVRTVPRPVDTERIVFMSYREGIWGIYVTDSTRTRTYQLTRNNVPFSETPHWSPDGQQVAFISQIGAYSQIFALDADGANFRQLTFDKTLKGGLSWRPK